MPPSKNMFIYKTMIKIKNISKKFLVKNSIVQALDNVSLEIEENDCFAIVGESGSGKTTLANIILGIYQYDSGEIWLDNYQLLSKRNLQLRKLIQFVQQNPMSTLNPKKTIFNTISLPLKIHKIVRNENIVERVEQLLIKEKLNLTYIFITHDLSVVKNIANKVLVMNKGQIDEFGITKEVFSNPKSKYTKTLIRAIPTVTDEEDEIKPKL